MLGVVRCVETTTRSSATMISLGLPRGGFRLHTTTTACADAVAGAVVVVVAADFAAAIAGARALCDK